MDSETIRVSGIEVQVRSGREVLFQDRLLGSVGTEERFGEKFWRAYDPEGHALKRFFSARHEAIRLLLINADLLDGLGF